MSPMRVWLGSMLLALGLLGVADAADVVDGSSTWDRWWLASIVLLAALIVWHQRRPTLGPVLVGAIGIALLADSQDGRTKTSSVRSSSRLSTGLTALIGGVSILAR
jgi:hypothetical protein